MCLRLEMSSLRGWTLDCVKSQGYGGNYSRSSLGAHCESFLCWWYISLWVWPGHVTAIFYITTNFAWENLGAGQNFANWHAWLHYQPKDFWTRRRHLASTTIKSESKGEISSLLLCPHMSKHDQTSCQMEISLKVLFILQRQKRASYSLPPLFSFVPLFSKFCI